MAVGVSPVHADANKAPGMAGCAAAAWVAAKLLARPVGDKVMTGESEILESGCTAPRCRLGDLYLCSGAGSSSRCSTCSCSSTGVHGGSSKARWATAAARELDRVVLATASERVASKHSALASARGFTVFKGWVLSCNATLTVRYLYTAESPDVPEDTIPYASDSEHAVLTSQQLVSRSGLRCVLENREHLEVGRIPTKCTHRQTRRAGQIDRNDSRPGGGKESRFSSQRCCCCCPCPAARCCI